jgi:hypothetical protein
MHALPILDEEFVVVFLQNNFKGDGLGGMNRTFSCLVS